MWKWNLSILLTIIHQWSAWEIKDRITLENLIGTCLEVQYLLNLMYTVCDTNSFIHISKERERVPCVLFYTHAKLATFHDSIIWSWLTLWIFSLLSNIPRDTSTFQQTTCLNSTCFNFDETWEIVINQRREVDRWLQERWLEDDIPSALICSASICPKFTKIGIPVLCMITHGGRLFSLEMGDRYYFYRYRY